MATSERAAAAREAYGASTFASEDELGRLDLLSRARTSLFPWRGQFSPDLVQILLNDHRGTGPVLDPFMGSGTVLFESLRAGRPSAGAEINPGAFVFARLAEVAAWSPAEREALLGTIQRCLGELVAAAILEPLDGLQLIAHPTLAEVVEPHAPWGRALLEAGFLLACRNKSTASGDDVLSAFHVLRVGLEGVEHHGVSARCVAADARYLPFADGSFEQVITSPPYINVFNYHQQFRAAVERLGYLPLRISSSEIGANRKHRQNRLLTVVQYCLDMSMAIDEMARLTRVAGSLTLVVGRESRVRKLPFDNGALLGSLLFGRPDLRLRERAERKFTSRYGEVIVEDLLYVDRLDAPAAVGDREFARAVGVLGLELAARREGLDPDVAEDLHAAILGAERVAPSPPVDPASAGLPDTTAASVAG